MVAVVQRVSFARVIIDSVIKSQINRGLLVLLGIHKNDSVEDVSWLAGKISNMRIFNDQGGKINLALKDVKGEILLISQFTLIASTRKGNRPSFIEAAIPSVAIILYQEMIDCLENETGLKIKTGEFGADMKVDLLNDGPVTIVLDTKNKF